ncbi:MAG: Rrf2 family transcriptional regulator [Clostridia bacterium]|nr:Rrf2 family transcriptional regulator [Bacillota bacterium]
MTSRARTFGIAPPRFHVAVHILVWLAKTGDVCPSNEIASEVRGHATFLRRVLAPLVQAGIVEAREGRVGGYTLAKPAERISLGEVYTVLRGAAAPGEKGAVGGDEGTGRGKRLDRVLSEILGQAEEQAVDLLSRITIADLARKLDLPGRQFSVSPS